MSNCISNLNVGFIFRIILYIFDDFEMVRNLRDQSKSAKSEDQWSCKRSPDTSAYWKYKIE